MLISKCLVLCVSDVDQITASGDGLIPDPHIGDVRICRIAIESRLYVPFQIDTSCIRINGVIPAIHGSAVKHKSDALSVALGKADPVVNVKNRLSRFSFRRFRCRRFLSCRRCWLFFFSRGSGFRSALNCTPPVRQYDILSNKWGVLLCQREYQTNDTRRNSRSWS